MAGLEVASLVGVLSLRDDATGSLRQFDNAISRAGDNISNFGGRLTGIGSSLGTVFLPLAAGIGAGISAAADFDSTLAEISARTGLTGTALDELRQTALQLGADTAFSAQDAAGAFLQLLSSGQTYEQALETIRPVLDAAAASGMGLAESADAVTNIMAMFRLPASRAVVVTNALARAAGASSATMAELSEGFANGGSVAAQFGLDVDDTAAILAVFSENGIKGAEAGTQLKSMLMNMGRNTDDVTAAWAELGTSLYDSEGRARDLNIVIDEMNRALAGMSDQDSNRILQTLGGSFGVVGLNALLASQGFDQMATAMAGSASATEVADAMMNTFNGRVDSLKGSVETLMIQALTPLMNDVLQPLVEKLTETVNGVTEWATANPEATKTIASLILGGAALSVGLVVLGTLLSAVGTVITFVGGAIALLKGGIMLLMSGALIPFIPILFLIGGMFLAYQNNVLGFRDRIDELRVSMGNLYTDAQGMIPDLVKKFDDLFRSMGLIPEVSVLGNNPGGYDMPSIGSPFAPRYDTPLPPGGNSFDTNSGDRRKSARGGGDTYEIYVTMPADALASPTRAQQRGREFGEAIRQEVRRGG